MTIARSHAWKAFIAAIVIIVLCNIKQFLVSSDSLALLSGTLRTYHRAVCDDHVVTLRCPPGTCISVQIAQYGTSLATLAELCPNTRKTQSRSNDTCLWPTAIQTKWEAAPEGTWGKTVVEACHKKRQCRFHMSPNTNGGDPCPGVRKYVEIAYKCRPYEFRSKVACEDDIMQLGCNPHSRVAVYSASFGRTEYETVRCPQPQGVREETCLVSYATEAVMQICHGKRHCSLTADTKTFGNPCHQLSRKYLKVVYTCVPRSVLRDEYSNYLEHDELLEPEEDVVSYEDIIIEDDLAEGHVYSESPKLAVAGGRHNRTNMAVFPPAQAPPTHEVNSEFQRDRESLLFYLGLSVTSGIVSILLLAIFKLLWKKHKHRSSMLHTRNISKSYTEDTSEGEADIDLTNLTQPSSVTILSSPQHHNQHHVHSPAELWSEDERRSFGSAYHLTQKRVVVRYSDEPDTVVNKANTGSSQCFFA